jgi:hypothetical protein
MGKEASTLENITLSHYDYAKANDFITNLTNMRYHRKPRRLFIVSLCLLLLSSGCSYFTIPTQDLVSQLKESQHIEENPYSHYNFTKAFAWNNLRRIRCVDKAGNKVWLPIDKNNGFIISRKSGKRKFKAYFSTVIVYKDTLIGVRSRFFGGVRRVPVNDIDKITISAEFPRVQKVDQ